MERPGPDGGGRGVGLDAGLERGSNEEDEIDDGDCDVDGDNVEGDNVVGKSGVEKTIVVAIPDLSVATKTISKLVVVTIDIAVR